MHIVANSLNSILVLEIVNGLKSVKNIITPPVIIRLRNCLIIYTLCLIYVLMHVLIPFFSGHVAVLVVVWWQWCPPVVLSTGG
jgi:hypothetical protein